MKVFLIFFFSISSLSSFSSALNAVWSEEVSTENQIQEYNLSDYDPWIPADWIKEDGTFGE